MRQWELNLLIPEYQQLTADVIENNDHNLSQKLPNVTVPAKQIHRNQKDQCFCCAGADAAANKLRQFGNHSPGRPVVALEDKGFVCQISKGNCHHPGNHITDSGGHSHKIITGNVNQVIDDGGADTKKEIGYDIPIFDDQVTNFLDHL